ncbi:MAG: HNH endonuclease [Muribaculum sp.]|nr:HNH endonuclease [Muribaculum sp.]
MAQDESKIKTGLRQSLVQQMRGATDDERELMAQFIENELGGFIVDYINADFQGIFEQTNSSYYDSLRKSIATNPEAKRADNANGNLYSKALIHYANFLSSKFMPKRKLRVEKGSPISTQKETKTVKESYVEGAVVQQTVDRRERNKEARDAAIYRDKGICQVCGFDFKNRYREIGAGYIEVHHTKPISDYDDEHDVKVEDLVCLCANCHAMAHRRRPEPFSIDELKAMLIEQPDGKK